MRAVWKRVQTMCQALGKQEWALRSIGQVAVGKQQQNGIGAAPSAAAAKVAAAAASGRACAPVHSHVVEARDGQPALVALQEELQCGVEATAAAAVRRCMHRFEGNRPTAYC